MSLTIAIVYASGGGRTRETAELCAAAVADAGLTVLGPLCAKGLDPRRLLEADGLLLGEPTWGFGTHHFDYRPFDDAMGKVLGPARLLAPRGAAAFVGCDRAYRTYGTALDLIEQRLLDCGARLLQRGLKIELQHTDASRAFTRAWARDFALRLRGELPHQPHLPRPMHADVDAVMGISPAERAARNAGGLRAR